MSFTREFANLAEHVHQLAQRQGWWEGGQRNKAEAIEAF